MNVELMRRSRALANCELIFDLKFPTSAYVRQLSCCVTHIYMLSRSSHAYSGRFDVLVAIATLIFLILSFFHIQFSRQEEWSKWSLIVYKYSTRQAHITVGLRRCPYWIHRYTGWCERSIQMGSSPVNRMRSCRSKVAHKQMLKSHSSVCYSLPLVG